MPGRQLFRAMVVLGFALVIAQRGTPLVAGDVMQPLVAGLSAANDAPDGQPVFGDIQQIWFDQPGTDGVEPAVQVPLLAQGSSLGRVDPEDSPGRNGTDGSDSFEFTAGPPRGFRFGDEGRQYDPATRPRSDRLGTQRFEGFGTVPLPEPYRPYRPDMPPRSRKLDADFSDGLNVHSEDNYFALTFHNLTQVDYRAFNPTGDPLTDNFVVPRQRWYLIGHVSQYMRYYTVINRGYGSLDLLDAFVDLNFGVVDADKLQIRVGRMKTPYTYEYIKMAETDLIAAERSVFVGNYAPNRQIGAMAHGKVVEGTVEYALGVFNGPRRSFTDYNDEKDIFTFMNVKPFLNTKSDLFKQLNVGGSFNYGIEHNPLQPAALRTANDQTPSPAAAQVSPTFLTFNPNVFEDGPRLQWSGDLTWYYRSFGLMAGVQGGYQDYGVSPTPIPANFVGVSSTSRVHVPLSGYEVSMFYFPTGELITRRVSLLQPRRSFGQGPGAIELFARFANLTLGGNVFTGGLASQAASSNVANVTDLGWNWYLNHYIKLTFDYQYAAYGNPVYLAPGRNTSFSNLFWSRVQVYF
ncbi:MAG TPA: porin [Pirellulales bacterium]|nr:porin [Pirellulales bacterium]